MDSLPADFTQEFQCSKMSTVLHFLTCRHPILDLWKSPTHAARNGMQIRRFQIPNSTSKGHQNLTSGASGSNSSKRNAKSSLADATSKPHAPIDYRRQSGRLACLGRRRDAGRASTRRSQHERAAVARIRASFYVLEQMFQASAEQRIIHYINVLY